MPAAKKKAKDKPVKKKLGKPEAVIDWSLVIRLCKLQNTLNDIAFALDLDKSTLKRRIHKKYGVKFTVFSDHWRSFGRSSLRRAQYRSAMRGSAPMQIWLGKNWLGQTDTGTVDDSDDVDSFTDEYL